MTRNEVKSLPSSQRKSVILLVLLAITATANADNLLCNPGFETGDTTCWNPWNWGGAPLPTITTLEKLTGTYSIACIKNASGGSGIHQQFDINDVNVGDIIAFSGYAKITGGSPICGLVIHFMNSDDAEIGRVEQTFGSPTDWAYRQVATVVPPGIAKIRFDASNNSGTSGTAYFDDLKVTAGSSVPPLIDPNDPNVWAHIYQFSSTDSNDTNFVSTDGGFAGHGKGNYNFDGKLQLIIDYDSNTAAFGYCDVNLTETVYWFKYGQGTLSSTQSLAELFELNMLAGSIVSDTQLRFELVRNNGTFPCADIVLDVNLLTDSIEITGGFCEAIFDGFHYNLTNASARIDADITPPAGVSLADFALFAQQWPNTNCGSCNGADFTRDGDVTLEDLEIFTGLWP